MRTAFRPAQPHRSTARTPAPVEVSLPGVGPRLLGIGVLIILTSALILFGAASPEGREGAELPVPAESR